MKPLGIDSGPVRGPVLGIDCCKSMHVKLRAQRQTLAAKRVNWEGFCGRGRFLLYFEGSIGPSDQAFQHLVQLPAAELVMRPPFGQVCGKMLLGRNRRAAVCCTRMLMRDHQARPQLLIFVLCCKKALAARLTPESFFSCVCLLASMARSVNCLVHN